MNRVNDIKKEISNLVDEYTDEGFYDLNCFMDEDVNKLKALLAELKQLNKTSYNSVVAKYKF